MQLCNVYSTLLQSIGLRRVAMGERYDCTECQESLYGHKYILKEEKPYCIKCYETLFSNTCEVCQKLISCTSKVKYPHFNCYIFLTVILVFAIV